MPELSAQSVPILKGKVVLTKRARSSYWQARYRIGRKWIRTSTKTEDLEEAEVFATDHYYESKFKEKNNIPIVTRKFSNVAEAVKMKLENDTSLVMAADYIRAIDNYLIPFFGSHNVATVDYPLIVQFNDWRVEKMKREPAMTTVRTHAAVLRRIFEEAVVHDYMSEAQVPSLKVKNRKGRKFERRVTFTMDEYRVLARFMITWSEQGTPGKPTDMRRLLREYVLILANSGIRHGTEALSMRWNRLKEMEDKEDGRHAVMAWVDGKTDANWAVMRPRCRIFLKRIKKRTEALKDLTWEETLQQDLPVFALPDGTVTNNLRQTFKKLLKDAKLLVDPITKQNRTLYSLRHFYITQAILADKMSPIKLAAQCRTSVMMLEKHYFHLDPVKHWKELSA